MKRTHYIATFAWIALLAPLLVSAQSKKSVYLETGGERKLDVVYKQVGKRQLELDLYYPAKKGSGSAPVVIYTHGGGWAAGSRAGAAKGFFALLFKELLDEGFAVASVDYRLYKKDGPIRMRDCVIDSMDAVRFLAKEADSLGLDIDRFFVIGDSAGGHIAQMLLLTPPSDLAGDADLAEVPYQVVAGVSWYGPCDFQIESLFNHDDRPGFRDRFGPRILGEDSSAKEKAVLYEEMSPITYLKGDSPPLLMIQGDQDTTIPVKHAKHMEKRAQEISAPVEVIIVENAGHNWRKVGGEIEPSRDEIIETTVDFLVRHADLN